MAGYLDKTLADGEPILMVARPHWVIVSYPAFAGLLLGVFRPLEGLVLGAVGVVVALLVRLGTEATVTDRRILVCKGLISRDVVDQKLATLESIEVKQDLLGRFLDYGTLQLRGTGDSHTTIENIAAPFAVKRAIDQRLDAPGVFGRRGVSSPTTAAAAAALPS